MPAKTSLNRPTGVVRRERLRDQIYDLIREEVKNGILVPGQRFSEVELAAKYGVSRTPVREALFQLAQDGLMVSEERGYTIPLDSEKSRRDRFEVHLLIDPRVAFYAAQDGSDEQIQFLEDAFLREKTAHKSDDFSKFVDASHDFRVTMRMMCGNEPLRRCAMLVEDQFLAARNVFFKQKKYRDLELRHTAKIYEALAARDAKAAETAVRAYMLAISKSILPKSDTNK